MMNNPSAPIPPASSQAKGGLKTGVGVVNRNDRVFKRGTLMFIEGEGGREMFIMRTGKVRILKQEGDRTVELAVLGQGSVLGELALLDNQPRGATAQVIEDVSATVIDEKVLESTFAKIPAWLVSVIKMVVSRLRETNKRTGDDIVKNNVSGVINILLMLLSKRLAQIENRNVVPLERLKEEVYSITGVSSGDTDKIVTMLILKEMLLVDEDSSGKEYVRVLNPSTLQMYMTYLRVKMRGGKMIGEDISDKAMEVAQLLISAMDKGGKRPDGTIQIGIPQLELHLQKDGKGRFVDPDGIDELVKSKIIDKVAVASALSGTAAKGAVSFDENKLRRVLMLRNLIPVFKEEVVL